VGISTGGAFALALAALAPDPSRRPMRTIVWLTPNRLVDGRSGLAEAGAVPVWTFCAPTRHAPTANGDPDPRWPPGAVWPAASPNIWAAALAQLAGRGTH